MVEAVAAARDHWDITSAVTAGKVFLERCARSVSETRLKRGLVDFHALRSIGACAEGIKAACAEWGLNPSGMYTRQAILAAAGSQAERARHYLDQLAIINDLSKSLNCSRR